ncbi:hypothetical protein G5B88_03945 [Herbaspirillum seropedicae]|jgi:hypothetical protein|uniref:Uncharacterized protein n=1 Tax=Herbaspirillum seropedicae (strain SmR1) TaxID=757424 RepID=D8IZI1_HERSS|nr:hypothetical protein [Herbaspirillum seropedicae]ADJ62301.1 hypothetical protein Hsero_0782 [Herbaspirillum seropedicae SmR1]AKN64451.1 hypothetical protein ACP92_03915 [Herbaspirillum seropedicae]UMU20375.1 hypothetical protein G5B88_03945 [Herbaspirillum seropedicae]
MQVKVDDVGLTVILLTAAEAGWGKGKVPQLMAQIVDIGGIDKNARARAYRLVRDAIVELPLTIWAQDKLNARRELLDELNRQVTALQAGMSNFPTPEELREDAWRQELDTLYRAAGDAPARTPSRKR